MPPGRFPFDVAPRLGTGRWGVWDNRHQWWAEKPAYRRETAERLAVLMIEAYAAGFADAMIQKCGGAPRRRRRLSR